MFAYFMTLAIFSILLFIALSIGYFKELPNKILPILIIIVWYTILNFLGMQPFLYIGHMNWIGKFLILFMSVLLIIYYKFHRKRDFVYFQFNENRNITIIIISAYILIVLGSLIVLFISHKFDWQKFLMNAVLVGISEEFYYRGFLYQKIIMLNEPKETSTNNTLKSIILCSLAFGVWHILPFRFSIAYNIYQFGLTFAVGIGLNIIYVKTKNIINSILIHNSLDTIAYVVTIVFLIPVQP
jgi:membrane protease YdiL (CAAX protease family)